MEKLGVIGCLILAIVLIAGIIGYVGNIAALCHCDFEGPYGAEIIRGVGVIVPFVGAIVGYMEIPDGLPINVEPPTVDDS